MTPDLKELERLARAATPGPWLKVGMSYHHYQIHGAGRDGRDSERICMTTDAVLNDAPPDTRTANAAYIAYANPAAILSLIAELEQAKKDAERYQWLRKSHHDDDSAIGVTREHMNGWGRVVGKSLRNSDLDKAIDAAIAKEQS